MIIGSSNTSDLVGPDGGLVGPGSNVIVRSMGITTAMSMAFGGSRVSRRAFSLIKHITFSTNRAVTKSKGFSIAGHWADTFKGGRLFFGTFSLSHPMSFTISKYKTFGRGFSINKPVRLRFQAIRTAKRVLRFINTRIYTVVNRLGILFRPN